MIEFTSGGDFKTWADAYFADAVGVNDQSAKPKSDGNKKDDNIQDNAKTDGTKGQQYEGEGGYTGGTSANRMAALKRAISAQRFVVDPDANSAEEVPHGGWRRRSSRGTVV